MRSLVRLQFEDLVSRFLSVNTRGCEANPCWELKRVAFWRLLELVAIQNGHKHQYHRWDSNKQQLGHRPQKLYHHDARCRPSGSTFLCKVLLEHLLNMILPLAYLFYSSLRSLNILVSWVFAFYGLDDRGSRVRFPTGDGIFLFTTAFRTALEPTQPPIQWVPGALSLGVKQPGREADHSPPSSAEVKEWVELYLHSPNTP
jgi:hypothetical protein